MGRLNLTSSTPAIALLVLLMAAALVASGCGASSPASACAGFRKPNGRSYWAMIVGQPQSRKFACQTFGAPRSIKHLRDGHELWTYGRGSRRIGTITIN